MGMWNGGPAGDKIVAVSQPRYWRSESWRVESQIRLDGHACHPVMPARPGVRVTDQRVAEGQTAPLPVLSHLALHHTQCRLSPSPSLPSQRARFHRRTPSPPPNIHLPQQNTHHPNRFLSQAPTSRDPSLARQGLLRHQTMFKPQGLLMVEVTGTEIQCRRLSPHHHRPGCVRTTRSPARPCIPARAQRLSSLTLYR